MKNYVKYLALLFTFSLTVTTGLNAESQTPNGQSSPCVVSGIYTDVRPNNKGPATKVNMGLRVIDVREINDVDQTITVDFALRLRWEDEVVPVFRTAQRLI